MTQDNRHYGFRTPAGMIPGLILAGVGALFLLSNLGYVPIYNWWQLWPLVVIAVGIVKLVDSPDSGEQAIGAIMVVVGGVFLATTFGWVSWRVWQLWPVALIGLGLVMLIQRINQDEEGRCWHVAPGPRDAGGVAIFGGFKRRVASSDYRGGDYSTIFGGCEIDLREAEIQGDSAIVNVSAIFGGVEIRVPRHWHVVNEMSGIFGGTDDKTAQPPAGAPGVKNLVMRGTALFGGISIKN
jgi:predicted membrane protein